MHNTQIVKILIVVACIALVAVVLYVGGTSMTQMLKMHMGG
jgi:hypothetical protein